MDEILLRVIDNLTDRLTGPMKFRLLLQPLMAATFAVLDGLKDAREGRIPYFWGLLKEADHRRERGLDGWKHVGKVFVLALILDAAYQVVVARFIYVGEAILVAILLAIVPYLLLRGLVNRLWRR